LLIPRLASCCHGAVLFRSAPLARRLPPRLTLRLLFLGYALRLGPTLSRHRFADLSIVGRTCCPVLPSAHDMCAERLDVRERLFAQCEIEQIRDGEEPFPELAHITKEDV